MFYNENRKKKQKKNTFKVGFFMFDFFLGGGSVFGANPDERPFDADENIMSMGAK